MSKKKEEKIMSRYQTALNELRTKAQFYHEHSITGDYDELSEVTDCEKALLQELVDRAKPTITDREFDLFIDSINLAQSHVRLELKRGIYSFPYTVYLFKSFGSNARSFYYINHALEYVVGIKDVLDSLAQNKGGL